MVSMIVAGIGSGMVRGMVNDDGEKPRTTVVCLGLISGDGSETWDGLSEVLEGDCDSVLVDPDLCRAGAGDGEGIFLGGVVVGWYVGAERGVLSFTIDTTILPKSSELMCRSRLLLLLMEESCLQIWGRTISRGADTEVNSTASSSITESTLPESWGISECLGSLGMF